jgi:polar amino acid transport system substrate-binding protein
MDTQWSGIIASLYAGHFDTIMAGIGHTKDRAQKVAFTIPYADASQRFLIRASDKDKLKSFEDLSGRVVGIKLGSVAEIVIKTVNPQIQKDRGKGFTVKTFDDLNPAYLALAQGSVDAVLNSIATMSVVLRDRPDTYALIKGSVGTDIWVGMATRKEDTDIVAFLNTELTRLRKNEQIYELQEKWFKFRMPLPDVLPQPGL